jgi:hypothetical protein
MKKKGSFPPFCAEGNQVEQELFVRIMWEETVNHDAY